MSKCDEDPGSSNTLLCCNEKINTIDIPAFGFNLMADHLLVFTLISKIVGSLDGLFLLRDFCFHPISLYATQDFPNIYGLLLFLL